MARSVFAVACGYLVVAAATFLTFFLAGEMPRPGTSADVLPSLPRQVFFLAASVVYAVVGGWVAAALARESPLRHALSLGAFMAVLAFVSLAWGHGHEPRWFQAALLVLVFPAAAAGGWLRCAQSQAHRSPRAVDPPGSQHL